MDPTTGRFLSIDSWEGSPFDPPSLHKYAYAGSDTIDKKDPTGRFSMAEFGAVVAIVAVISAIAHASYTAVTGGTKSEIALSAGKGFLLGAGVAATVYAVLWGGTIAYIAGATGASLATARQVLSAFHRANINIIRLEKDLVVYRWYGGRAALMRPWWTTELYGSAAEATRNLALDPRFGNTAERMATGVIQRGTQVLIGQAAAQGVLPGLGIQVYAADPSVVRIVTAY
jgi:hypothetical protein